MGKPSLAAAGQECGAGAWANPNPWELPCPQPDTSPTARPGFRHPAIPPRSLASGKQDMEVGAAKANTGSGNCCSGSSPPAGSCKSPVGLAVPPQGCRAPPGLIFWGKQGPGAPCNVLHPCSSLSPRAAPSLWRRGEGGHQSQPPALLLAQARLGNAVGTAEEERWLCPCIAPAGSIWPWWHPLGSGSRQSSGCRSRWFSLSQQQSQCHAAFSQAQRAQ